MNDSPSTEVLGEKRSALTGGAATDEVIASSRSVLAPSRSGRARGLQQFFTPLAVAGWIANTLGQGGQVLDPTAGDGTLLSGFSDEMKFGVELDADQVRAAGKRERGYQAVRGDLQRVFPLLRRVGVELSTVVLNPPFGLEWQVPALEPPKGSSTLLAFQMARSLLASDGQGCLVAGRDRFQREILPAAPDAFFAVIEVERLFPGVDLPCVLAFFVSPRRDSERVTAARVTRRVRSKAELDDELLLDITRARRTVLPFVSRHVDRDLPETWRAVQAEYDRRLGLRNAQQKHTLELEGGRLRVRPSAFTKIAIAKMPNGSSQNRWLESFDRQAPSYFAMQGKEWRRLLALEAEGTLTIADTVRRAVDAAAATNERIAVPLYELTPAQRLGFLVDLDHIRCTVSAPERGFVAGETYPIACDTEVLAQPTTRQLETPKGPEVYEVLVERKCMRITIGDQRFSESTADLEYLLGHFEIPDPGEIATRFPGEITRWEEILAEVEREIQEREPGFKYFWFQPRDLARLLFKQRGLLGWEQGCGKSLGAGTLVRALEKSGDLDDGCALFVMPQDLVQQFRGEIRRFFGREVLCVGSTAALGKLVPGPPSPAPFASSDLWRVGVSGRRPPAEVTAVKVRDLVHARREDLAAQRRGVHLAPRPPVWAVTWFEALAITQRLDEPLPAERVLHQIEPAAADSLAPSEPRKPKRKETWSGELCPACRADTDGGWKPWSGVCSAPLQRSVDKLHLNDQVSARRRVCGYVHRAFSRKPAYAILKDLFDAVIVDEGTKIQGESFASKGIRAFRPRFRFVATGTAIKNFIPSAFWLLWWSLGDASPRFPYAYRGGKERFTADFAVTESKLDEYGHKAKNIHPKILPEVSNLLRLWRILCSSVVRRRMDEVGVVISLDGEWHCHACKQVQKADVGAPGSWKKPERVICSGCLRAWDTIVPISYVPVEVPWGAAQKRAYLYWLSKENFQHHFLRKHPETTIPPHLISRLAAGLGQLAKLSYATVDPTSDPDDDYRPNDLSPWTPARLQTLTLAEEHVAAGEQVVIASPHVALGPWVAAHLEQRGIAAGHICELDADGRATTMSPKERAAVIARFKRGELRVLCVGVQAVNLGHNLDCASVIILDGLPWDHATRDQMVKRVRRLTSKRPVTAYLIMPTASLTTKIWASLKDKAAASDLALDAKLARQDETPIDRAAILRELQEEGAVFDGTEVPEREVLQLWNSRSATGDAPPFPPSTAPDGISAPSG